MEQLVCSATDNASKNNLSVCENTLFELHGVLLTTKYVNRKILGELGKWNVRARFKLVAPEIPIESVRCFGPRTSQSQLE